MINWWSYCSDVVREVYGEDGGHAGNTETAFMMAVDPALVQKDRYSGAEMATPIPAPNTWSAYPFPSSILLYTEGQGYPELRPGKGETLLHQGERKNGRADRGNDREVGNGEALGAISRASENFQLFGRFLKFIQLLQHRFLFFQCLVVGSFGLLQGFDCGLERRRGLVRSGKLSWRRSERPAHWRPARP